MPEAKEKRCHCTRCKWDSRVRGVIRRGEKGEMRAMIRELHEINTELGEHLDSAHEIIEGLTCHCEHEEKQETIN